MLVLSRRVDDSIVFPDLGITIEVLQVKGKAVRVGVDAPIEIKVLRGELEDQHRSVACFDLSGESEHAVRNKLNSLNLAAALAQKFVEKGEFNQAANTLQTALSSLKNDAASTFEPAEDNLLSALLVEDVENEREMLAGFLRLHGIHVSSVPDSERAIQFLEANSKPDFMMVDIGLPGKSGAELIVEVRSNPAFDGIKLFAISGHTPREARISPTENRIVKWFQKPLKPSLLINEIEQSVGQLTPKYSNN